MKQGNFEACDVTPMTRKILALLVMDSTSQSPELGRKKGGRYCVAGFPNGVSCENGQFAKGVSLHITKMIS